jgi:hypothetical protein
MYITENSYVMYAMYGAENRSPFAHFSFTDYITPPPPYSYAFMKIDLIGCK